MKTVVLSTSNNLSGGTVGNLLYGGSVCVWANADIEMIEKNEKNKSCFHGSKKHDFIQDGPL